MPRRHFFLLLACTIAVGGALTACTATRSPSSQQTPITSAPSRTPAVAHLLTATGKPSGRADLTETPDGVEIAIAVQGLTPGQHGFHIHANGACAPGPDPATGQTVAFGAAGGHFDPGTSRNHGQPGEPAHQAHAGDLPNITVGADGNGSLRYLRPGVTLSRGPEAVFGRALVVHERADDQASEPAGNSGGRVLCGVIGAAQPGAVTGRAIIEGANAYPEGIAIDARNGTAYVGSTSEGHIWRIARGVDTAELFQMGGAAGRQAAFGMKVDAAGRLWVAGGPQGNVAVIDLVSGMTVGNYKSPPDAHTFLNDLVVAPDGHVYVTDSFRPVIFRARQAPGAPATLEPWLDLSGTPIRYQPNQINLNGIVASPDGKWLMAIQLVTGQLWRVDMASKSVLQVQVHGGDLRRGDGLVLRGPTALYVVRNADNEIAQLQLTEDWSQARLVQRIVDPGFKFPTTAAIHQGELKVVNAQLDKLKQPPPVLPFEVLTLTLP
jgi:Cu-Zn family superoxide dismutase